LECPASWNPGPNSPLSDGCHNSTQPNANAKATVQAWTKAGFPASKLVLGVPAYGYINPSDAAHLHTRRSYTPGPIIPDVALPPQRRSDTSSQVVIVKNPDGGTDGGQVQYNELVRQGALIMTKFENSEQKRPVAEFVGDGGFTRFWDDCSSTPFLTSPYVNQVITYDDPASLDLKAAFVKDAGLLGVSMFDITGDTSAWDLTKSLRSGLGLSTP
jgi:chitinase